MATRLAHLAARWGKRAPSRVTWCNSQVRKGLGLCRAMSTSCYQATYPPPPADSVTAQFADFSSAPDRHDLPLVVRPEFITDEEHDMLVKLFHKKLRRCVGRWG